jgi:HPt (histidine-containing phosphotransfer) domain-containing protein
MAIAPLLLNLDSPRTVNFLRRVIEGWSTKPQRLPAQLQTSQTSSPAVTKPEAVGASFENFPPDKLTNSSSLGAERPSGESASNLPDACDPTILDELRTEDETLLRELAGIFQGEVTKALGELDRALTAGDCPAAARIAHMLKGSAGNFGATQLQELAARMDQAASTGHADEATGLYENLRSECERVCLYLVAEINP